jgi:hypothetical protein
MQGKKMFLEYEERSRNVRSQGLLIAACVALCVATSTPLFAQGAMGGTVGKQDKAVSGADEASAPSRKTSPKAKAHASAESRNTGAGKSLSGVWSWTGQCAKYDKPYTGTLTVNQTGNTFTATHGNTNMWDGGKISDGRISGNHVSFVRSFGGYTDHLNLALSGSGGALRMSGVLPNTEHSGRCVMVFTKS